MKLKDFLQNIALGELHSTSITELESLEVRPEFVPKVIQSLNQALTYMYSMYPLRTSQVTIKLHKGVYRYYLDSNYSSHKALPKYPHYLLDSLHEPFIDNVIRIVGIVDELGNTIDFNDCYTNRGVHTPEYNCVKVSDDIFASNNYIQVSYLASHERIPLTEPVDSNFTLRVPTPFIAALQTYTACLILSNQGGEKNMAISNALYAKFKTLTEELKKQGIGEITHSTYNHKPALGEWL